MFLYLLKKTISFISIFRAAAAAAVLYCIVFIISSRDPYTHIMDIEHITIIKYQAKIHK
jgi:hypothetical protein